ncbi:MAG: PDZ domain-containing protein [Phycisphaerae bacterium]|nr:PDZ domain-containing protein [Phycisphaerae bacterium]NUQ47699.1 PDZ domain-containing protein [Phycisphaerae bacterium]
MLGSMMTWFSMTLLNMLIASQCGAIKCPDEPRSTGGGVISTVTADVVPAITWAAPVRTGDSEPADASGIRAWRVWRGEGQPVVALARPDVRIRRTGPAGQWLVVQDPQAEEASEDPPAGSPFLGIRYSPIPKALAAHIGTEQGVLVLNVVEGSPADEARLQQYDVITDVGDRPAPPDAAGFIKMAQELGVGETVPFRIIRGAKPMTVDIRIGARPANAEMKYKYESPPEEEAVSSFMFKPNFFTFDKDGKFIAPDAESLKKMHDMLPQLKFDRKGDWSKLPGGVYSTCVIVRQSDDGKSVEIRRDADGKITVKRTTKDGRTDTVTYDSEDALRDGDAEAFRMFKDCISEQDITIGIGGLPGERGKLHKFLDEDIEKRVKEALEAYQESMKGHGATMKHLERTMRDIEKRYGVSTSMQRHEGVRFEKLPDGSIKVTTRRGDDEMTETFANENTMKRERPELFERFNSLQQRDDAASE